MKPTCSILIRPRSPQRSRVSAALSSPLVHAGIVPFLLLNIFLAVYQGIWFPIEGIPKGRADDLILDRGASVLQEDPKAAGILLKSATADGDNSIKGIHEGRSSAQGRTN